MATSPWSTSLDSPQDFVRGLRNNGNLSIFNRGSQMQATNLRGEVLHALSSTDQALFSQFGLGDIVELPFECIHHAFEYRARNQPNIIAVQDIDDKTTYAELDHQANSVASHLRGLGVAANSRVGLLAERSILMVIGIIAILKTGAAYVPLDGSDISNDLLNYGIQDCGSNMVLAQSKFANRVTNTSVLCLEDSICPHSSSTHCRKTQDLATSEDSACIIYAQDSSYNQKGIELTHRNILNLICISPGNLGMRQGLRVSQITGISSALAVWEILGSLCNGSTLILGGTSIREWNLVMKMVDIVIATPTMLSLYNPAEHRNIKIVAAACDRNCSQGLINIWARFVQFYTCHGSTETTIANTMQLHSPGSSVGPSKVVPNNTVYILDEQRRPVEMGGAGIVWIGGAGVSRGYLNLSRLTSLKYRYDPFLNNGMPMFDTGELARWRPDGSLEYADENGWQGVRTGSDNMNQGWITPLEPSSFFPTVRTRASSDTLVDIPFAVDIKVNPKSASIRDAETRLWDGLKRRYQYGVFGQHRISRKRSAMNVQIIAEAI